MATVGYFVLSRPRTAVVPVPTYISMFEVLQQRDLPDGRTRSPLLVLQSDLLQRHYEVRQPRFALVDRGVSSLQIVPLNKSSLACFSPTRV